MSESRVVLADDHEVVVTGLRALVGLRRRDAGGGRAGDGREAVARARELTPDVVVMDVPMPEWTASRPPGGSRPSFPACGWSR